MRVPENYEAAFEESRIRLVDERSMDTLAAAELALNTAAKVEKQFARLHDAVKASNFPEFVKEARKLEECFAMNQKLVKEMHKRQDEQGEALDEINEKLDKLKDWVVAKFEVTA